jgi:hypothetical protein
MDGFEKKANLDKSDAQPALRQAQGRLCGTSRDLPQQLTCSKLVLSKSARLILSRQCGAVSQESG